MNIIEAGVSSIVLGILIFLMLVYIYKSTEKKDLNIGSDISFAEIVDEYELFLSEYSLNKNKESFILFLIKRYSTINSKDLFFLYELTFPQDESFAYSSKLIEKALEKN